MTLPGQEFLSRYEQYMKKVQDGKWLEQHALDLRNSDVVQTRIQLDTDSRECIAYLTEMINMCNDVRRNNGLGDIQK